MEGKPQQEYNNRLEYIRSIKEKLSKQYRWLALARLGIFLLTLVLIYFAVNWGYTALSIILVSGIAVFLFVVRQHLKMGSRISHLEKIKKINEDELKALDHDFGHFDPGAEFISHEHPYASDLDIFGKGSVFQFINRTSTFRGKSMLASWLASYQPDAGAIEKRQQAVRELSVEKFWREEFRATGYEAEEKREDSDELIRWVDEPAEFHRPAVLAWLIIIPVLGIATITFVALGSIPAIALLFFLGISLSVSARYKKLIDKKHRNLGRRATIIEKYSRLLTLIENMDFNSSLLKEIKSSMGDKELMPGKRVKKLYHILNAFDTRLNLIAGFLLNTFFLWDMIQARRLENWVAENKGFLPEWIAAVAEIDSLASLANFRYNYPETTFPEPGHDDDFIIDGEGLGHPIIPEKDLVRNPVLVNGGGKFQIITGANMAGKSTYLRTVGVNLVLAMAGAPVSAKRFIFSPVRIMTSIRTSDSLLKNESYFYAELKRLGQIIGTLESGERLFILLDEILKGTNSKDKQAGSMELMKKLLNYKAYGLVATHDLALGELEQEYPGEITNRSFEVVIRDDQLVFDYKIRDGIARQMNATFLMKKMGIT